MKSFSLLFVTIITFILLSSTVSYSDEFSPDSIIGITRRVATYHLKGGLNQPNSWDGGAYLTGIMAMHRLTKDTVYLNAATRWSVKFKWMPCMSVTTTSADDICCCQTYCEIYLLDPKPTNDSMIVNFKTNLQNLFYTVKQRGIWSWDDALYMAPPAVSRYCLAVKNNEFLDSMDRYWWTTSANLYDTNYHLWYRDGGFKSQRAANGQPVFWSCGVAWVMGGITRVLQTMPLDYPQRPKWETQFKEMAAAIKAEQGFNNTAYSGLWTTSMRDHTQWPDPESSASSFFCFGMAWGINNHVLDSAQYIGCVHSAWRDLVKNVGTDGRLQRCQTVNWQPDNINVSNSSVEGEAAFMLAGEEMWKLSSGNTVSVQNKSPTCQSTSSTPKAFIFSVGRTRAIAVPPDVRPVEIFTLQGKRLCSAANNKDGWISIRNGLLKNSVYVVKYTR